ncbi:hypothetical protein N7522_004435 [Penicillium canescens]|nr:hypothetical protein N7522_004435 [Penicillium canescens]
MSGKPMKNHLEAGIDMHAPIRAAEIVLLPIPRDTFEKLYVSPNVRIVGNIRCPFGNPTPTALMGILVAATPNAMLKMGWRGFAYL